jgi:hypothetical protein
VQLVLLALYLFFIFFTNNLQYIFTYIIHKIFIQQIQSFFAPIRKPPPAMDGGRRGVNALFQLFTGEKYSGVCCVATGPSDYLAKVQIMSVIPALSYVT